MVGPIRKGGIIIKVNDGKGIFDNIGLCDSLKIDLNNLLKNIVSGQLIQASGFVVQMVQKIENLKTGISADLAGKDKIIEELKRINDSLSKEITGEPVERGDTNGDR